MRSTTEARQSRALTAKQSAETDLSEVSNPRNSDRRGERIGAGNKQSLLPDKPPEHFVLALDLSSERAGAYSSRHFDNRSCGEHAGLWSKRRIH